MSAAATDIDLYADEVLVDPYPAYDEIRSLGALVWMNAHDAFVITRFDEARAALRDWSTFVSGRGVSMNEPTNAATGGHLMLCMDGDDHARVRRIVGAPLTPKALSDVRAWIDREAADLIGRLVVGGRFDVATDLSEHLPVTIVSHLVGVPEDGRAKLTKWGFATFDSFGPLNDRCLASAPAAAELAEFAATRCGPADVRPGSWIAGLWQAVDDGLLEPHEPLGQMMSYLRPSLDTTINATTNLIWLLARHPEQYAALRANPELIPNAIDEALRVETTVQHFSRFVPEAAELGGVIIPAGSRVLVSWGAANRDPRVFVDPERFDVGRANASDHLALGHGRHVCAGAQLARMEMRALLTEFVARVSRIEVVEERRQLNNVLRGFSRLVVEVS